MLYSTSTWHSELSVRRSGRTRQGQRARSLFPPSSLSVPRDFHIFFMAIDRPAGRTTSIMRQHHNHQHLKNSGCDKEHDFPLLLGNKNNNSSNLPPLFPSPDVTDIFPYRNIDSHLVPYKFYKHEKWRQDFRFIKSGSERFSKNSVSSPIIIYLA